MEVTREEMIEFAKKETFHLDDRLCPFSREELRAEAWLQGYDFAKRMGVVTVPNSSNKRKNRNPWWMRFLDNMLSIVIYTVVLVVILTIAVPNLSARELIGFSMILGFFAGAINNIERVLRELFDK